MTHPILFLSLCPSEAPPAVNGYLLVSVGWLDTMLATALPCVLLAPETQVP